MVAEWVACLDKRPADRTGEDLDIIYSRLKDAKAFEKFHPMLLQQICYYGYYEDLEKGITLFRQGDLGTNWYAVLAGSLDVHVSDTGDTKDSITLCTLGIGTAFGESVLDDSPRHATIITSEPCELLRVEQKDFKLLWERNKQFMEGVLTPLSSQLPEVGVCHDGSNKKPTNNEPSSTTSPPKPTIHTTPTKKAELPKEPPNPALPITEVPSEKLAHAGKVIRTVILSRAPHMIRDRKYHLRTYRRCMVGTEMVDWLLQQGSWVHSRNQAVGMWQALLEEGVIANVTHEHQFKDKYLFYRFRDDDLGIGTMPTISEKKEAEDELQETLSMLAQIGPDAMMRMILRKPPQERTSEDLEVIYEELLHIKALSHLSTMVKRELASVLVFESHPHSGTVLFNQGDEGKSWYIILKGSVNVVIYGKGVVCTLHEGDDFGKLALVNDAPRAATIVLREDNCHFLRVDKEDFNRILRDVEANTVRLKEHGQDVLVLEKIPTNTQEGGQSHYKYSVMAGTPEKMLEHLLETRIDCKTEDTSDTFQEDFLLTYEIFMPSSQLCPALMAHYMTEAVVTTEQENDEFILANKKRVIKFVQLWADIARDALFEDTIVNTFLEELYEAVVEDNKIYGNLMDEVRTVQKIAEQRERYIDEQDKTKKRTKSTGMSHFRRLSKDFDERRKPIKASDETIFKVYCADHTYSTLKLPMDATAEMIKQCAAAKLCLGDDLLLVEVKATGEQVVIKEGEVSVPTGLSLNGRLFIAPREHLDALTPLPDQEGPLAGTASALEMMSSREIAYQMTLFDWELFTCVHEYELIYHVFGRHKFAKIMSNLDMFMRRFNEVQYWIATELCLTPAVSKRVQLLRKFIKIAAYCREYQNMNSFFAIVMGLSNIAISRLSQTWEKLPNKFKKLFGEFETLMDPSRNHRVYRLTVSKMAPPIIPFMPLLMKDMTFTHEGNKTYLEGLVNFEKMHMLAQTLRTIRYCRSKPLNVDPPPPVKNLNEIRNYIRSFSVIDNQRRLTQLSHKLEPRRS